ncbi:MAG: hypothetical protein EHM79_02390 [Geobacter sp.]|nr:MAG: hypothetical protein EHM79_02390 [Geobacter sp.]
MSRIEDALAKANQLRKSNVTVWKDAEPDLPPSIGRRKGNWCLRYGIGIPVVLVICFGIYLYVDEVLIPSRSKSPAKVVSGKSSSAALQPSPVKSSTQKNSLPSSIPLNSLDAAYSSSHPGWQRYVTESMEFRVFRKERTVKALQVLSRQEKPITVDFFTAFIVEIAGANSFKVQSVEEKDGYCIEKGVAGDTVDVVVYRKKPVREIKAFVIAYL